MCLPVSARGARPPGGTPLTPCGCVREARLPGNPASPAPSLRPQEKIPGAPATVLMSRSSLPGRPCGGRGGHRAAQRLRAPGYPRSLLRARQLHGSGLSHPEEGRAGASRVSWDKAPLSGAVAPVRMGFQSVEVPPSSPESRGHPSLREGKGVLRSLEAWAHIPTWVPRSLCQHLESESLTKISTFQHYIPERHLHP